MSLCRNKIEELQESTDKKEYKSILKAHYSQIQYQEDPRRRKNFTSVYMQKFRHSLALITTFQRSYHNNQLVVTRNEMVALYCPPPLLPTSQLGRSLHQGQVQPFACKLNTENIWRQDDPASGMSRGCQDLPPSMYKTKTTSPPSEV